MGGLRAGLAALVVCVLCAGPAWAEPGNGPRETIDQTYTTTAPGAATGVGFSGRYHAANDPQGNPPYMRRMTFYPPAGARFDTSVPDQCKATDAELEARGPAACPPGSVIGGGTTEGIFYAPVTHAFVFDHYTHHLDVINNAGEQILLVESEGWTVVRGHFQPDGSLDFNSPTCFPSPPTGQCGDDYILQLASATTVPEYTNSKGSYVTTPATCPAEGHWTSTVHFWWADGAVDSVDSTQPCG